MQDRANWLEEEAKTLMNDCQDARGIQFNPAKRQLADMQAKPRGEKGWRGRGECAAHMLDINLKSCLPCTT